MIELSFLETGKTVEKTGYGETKRVFLDMLSLRCLTDMQVEMSARSLNVFRSSE